MLKYPLLTTWLWVREWGFDYERLGERNSVLEERVRLVSHRLGKVPGSGQEEGGNRERVDYLLQVRGYYRQH